MNKQERFVSVAFAMMLLLKGYNKVKKAIYQLDAIRVNDFIN